MKVTDLFEAQAPSAEDKKRLKLSGGAYYTPRYDDDRKQLLGSVMDWLDTMDITKEDIAVALKKFKESAIFKKANAQEGFKHIELPASEKKGTISFETKRSFPSGKKFSAQYKIYANGQIRYSAGTWTGGTSMTRLNSPKPRMKAGDPVGSLVGIWTASLEEVLKKWEKALDKMSNQPFASKAVRESEDAPLKLSDEVVITSGEFKGEHGYINKIFLKSGKIHEVEVEHEDSSWRGGPFDVITFSIHDVKKV